MRSKTAEVFQRDDGFNFGDGVVVVAGGVWCGVLDVCFADDFFCDACCDLPSLQRGKYYPRVCGAGKIVEGKGGTI